VEFDMEEKVLLSIANLVEKGDVKKVRESVELALREGFSAEEILNKGFMVGMNRVGEKFRNGKIFIPEVLISARSMQAGIDLLEPHFSIESVKTRKKLLIGTVEGDLHDLGKNIVSIVFKGAGFEVVDLGINVSWQKFLEEAEKHKPDVIGLSSLLTTTMVSMKNIVKKLKDEGLESLVIVGGAPVSEEFAVEIGADLFGSSAMDGLEKVKRALELV